jgi:pimeloyl-ACP methyl ester carboxylesterase
MSDEDASAPNVIVEGAPNAWTRTGRGFVAIGRAIGSAGAWCGGVASSAYLAIDPDLRRHLAQLPLMGLTLLSSRHALIEAQPDDGQRPIVFVHGLMGHPGNFLGMRKYLGLHGRRRSYALALDPAATIEANAESFRHAVHEIARVNELPADARVDCVAHSLGGLVVRLALEDATLAARVANVVTLGTPHLGTHAARFGATPNVLALRPGSPVMLRLATQLPWRPPLPRLVALWSAADVLLLPADSARAEGAEAIEMHGFTHYSYLLHPRSWEVVRATLAAEPHPLLTPA